MKGRQVVAALSTAVALCATSSLAFAQSSTPDSGGGKPDHGMMGGQGMMGDGHRMDHGGMMGGDMKGMMGMMHGCSRMMGSSSGAGGMMPHLPPGNDKLEFRMRAEMMQKMGEIMLKYADRIKAPAPGPR
jgi:hypothetical protein